VILEYLKNTLELETEKGRAKLLKDGSALLRAFLGLDDQMWRDLVEIILEDHGMDWDSVYESDGDHASSWDGNGEFREAERAVPGPVVEFTPIDRLITQVVNSCNTAGKAAVERVKAKLDELSAEIVLFAETYREEAEDMVSTYKRLIEMAADLKLKSTPYSKQLYSLFEGSRQLKTALNLRKSRIGSVLHWVEYPLDPMFKAHKLKNIGASEASLREWIEDCKFIWVIGIGYANENFYDRETGYSNRPSFDLTPPNSVQELAKQQQFKLVNATLKEWDLFVQETFHSIYDPGITSKISSRMSQYEESILKLLSHFNTSENKRTNWQASESKLLSTGNNRLRKVDLNLPSGVTLDVKARLSLDMAVATSATSISFIFSLLDVWKINLGDLKLKLSLAIQKFPALGDVEVTLTTRIDQFNTPQVIATIPMTVDETWLTSLRVFLLDVLDELIQE